MLQPSTYTPCLESHAQLDPARTHGIIDVWGVVTEALCRYPHSLPTSALTQQVWAFRSHTAPCALCPHCGCPCLSALHVVCSSIRGRTPASTGIMFAANLIGPGDSDRLGHSMCRGVSTTPSARRTAHTRTPCVMHAVQQQCSATRYVTPTSGMTPVWGVTHDSTQGAAGNHG